MIELLAPLKKPAIVIINGCGGSGKDTFIKLVDKYYPNVIKLDTSKPSKDVYNIIASRFADVCPELVKSCADKDNLYRDTLSELCEYLDKDQSLFKYNFINTVLALTSNEEEYVLAPYILFVVAREKWKIDSLFKLADIMDFQASIMSLLIEGKTDPKDYTNPADSEVFDIDYDLTIKNDSTIEKLEEFAIWFVDEYLRDKQK